MAASISPAVMDLCRCVDAAATAGGVASALSKLATAMVATMAVRNERRTLHPPGSMDVSSATSTRTLRTRVRCPPVLGTRDAVVAEIRRYEVHGSPHVQVALAFSDRTFATAQLGAESVPAGVEAGDPVLVRYAMNVVVALERPAAADRS